MWRRQKNQLRSTCSSWDSSFYFDRSMFQDSQPQNRKWSCLQEKWSCLLWGETKRNTWTGNWSVGKLQGDKRTGSHKSPWHTSFNKKDCLQLCFMRWIPWYMFLSVIFNNSGVSIQSQPLSLPRIKESLWTIYLIGQSGCILQFWICDFSVIIPRIKFETIIK